MFMMLALSYSSLNVSFPIWIWAIVIVLNLIQLLVAIHKA